MSDAPQFFLPSLDTVETDFDGLARLANRPVPALSERIYSITFVHDGAEWTATVGKQLRGVQKRAVRTGGATFERERPVLDLATVIAIFPGVPYIVVTDHGIERDVGSTWENPFMAGKPKSVRRFTP